VLFRKKPVLKYMSTNVNEYADLIPAKNGIPKWYKDIQRFPKGFPPKNASKIDVSVKACAPFLDALNAGYLVTTSYDLVVSYDVGPEITWRNGGQLVSMRNTEENDKIPVPVGFSHNHFAWKFPIHIEVPHGYSLLVTHPLNRMDLPFYTLSGIVDGKYVMPASGNLPFFMKTGFEGVIPQGTPIAQIIPIKQENWKMKKDLEVKHIGEMNIQKTSSVLSGWYKKNFWKKKNYD